LRTWAVKIEITNEGKENLDETLDDIAKQVEDLITSNRSLGGLSTTILYTGSEAQFDGGGDKPIGTKTLNYNIQYTY